MKTQSKSSLRRHVLVSLLLACPMIVFCFCLILHIDNARSAGFMSVWGLLILAAISLF